MRHLSLLPFLVLVLPACGGREHSMPDMGSSPDGSTTDSGGGDAGHDAGSTDAGTPDLPHVDLGEPCGSGLFCGSGSYCCNTCCLPNSMPICLPTSCDHVDGGPRPDGGPTDGGGHDGDVDGGTTGASCGGFGGGVCAHGYFCDYSLSAMCGATDATGTCAAIPMVCMPLVSQVCGCDGLTYSNECYANAAGTSVMSLGPCSRPPPPPPPPPAMDAGPAPDCRTTGCARGESCELCWTSWACLPPGVAC